MSIQTAAKIILWRGLQQALIQSIMGTADAGPETTRAYVNSNPALAAKLRELADAMQKTIDQKMNPATAQQRYTARRASIAASMRDDGYRMQKTQAAMRWLADQWEKGTCPDLLRDVRSRKSVESILHAYHASGDAQAAQEILKSAIDGAAPAVSPQQSIREMEEKLRGQKIDGFFPTPRSVWDWMKEDFSSGPVRWLNVWLNDRGKDKPLRICDPSAGIGSLLDYLTADFPKTYKRDGWQLFACEQNYRCREILSAKGYKSPASPLGAAYDDTLDMKWDNVQGGQFDVILMNPPFENRADAKHVMHVFDHLLKPGGIMLAIMSRGPFFASDKMSTEFRQWLSHGEERGIFTRNGECELPEGSFNGKDSFRPTGVSCNVIVIEKSPNYEMVK